MPTDFHAEHVGSLLRPPYLLEARDAREAGTLSADELRAVEDRAITELIGVQEQVIDPANSGATRAAFSAERALDAAIAVDAAIVSAVKREHPEVTVGMHICRGNYRSSWLAQGSYEPVAERLFNEVPVDRFLLEYDTERAGGFEPLRFVPPGPTVVLGLVTTKVPQLEDQDELCRRVDEAARFVPLENLAISPQCGFASGSLGNLISPDDQRRKLDLVVSAAGQVWG